MPKMTKVAAALGCLALTLTPPTIAHAGVPSPSARFTFADLDSTRAAGPGTHAIPIGRIVGQGGNAHADQRAWLAQRRLDDEEDLRTACARRLPEAGASPIGWLRDRFQQCYMKRQDVTALGIDGKPWGKLWYDLWVLGWANNGVRQVDYLVSVENIIVQTLPGHSIDWRNTRLKIDFKGCAGAPDINCPDDSDRDGTLDQWNRVPSWALTFRSPDTAGAGADRRVSAQLGVDQMLTPAPGDNILPGTQYDAVRSRVRFDSAGRAVAGRDVGTVFLDFPLVYSLSLSDPQIRQSARHIDDALRRPERTFPSWNGKSVPGGSAGEPLHRMVDGTDIRKNRDTAVLVCKDVWGNDYAAGGLQCDEFPFASTYEGAYTGSIPPRPRLERFSARPIDGDDNNAGGGTRLGTHFYLKCRILDGEAFHVKILP